MSTSPFAAVPRLKIGRNHFDMSHDVKLSFNMGKLIPTVGMFMCPGDKVHINSEVMVRLAPLVSPMMHRVNVFQHFYFVPFRILWDGFNDFFSNGGAEPGSGFSFPAHPFVKPTNAPDGRYKGTLIDYFGWPLPRATGQDYQTDISPWQLAAYQKIYDDVYRDQNLEASVFDGLTDGDNTAIFDSVLNQVRSRCWEHDYFTSCLPTAQKGPIVAIPIVSSEASGLTISRLGNATAWKAFQASTNTAGSTGAVDLNASGLLQDAATHGLSLDPQGNLAITAADLAATGGTMNDLRNAMALMEWYERFNRGGSRNVEVYQGQWEVRTSDARLQRPEYICGSVQPMVISEVLQTSQTDTTPQGNMAGHGISAGRGESCSFYCEEYGVLVGIVSVMPKTAYQQGLPKAWTYMTPTDYPWPAFAHLGEQPVLNQELMYNFGDITDYNNEATFGYNPIYSNLKFENNRVAGDFRDNLAYWHMGRIFDPASPPNLNNTFVSCDPTFRVFAVIDPTVDHLYAHVMHNIGVSRKLPLYSVPGGFTRP